MKQEVFTFFWIACHVTAHYNDILYWCGLWKSQCTEYITKLRCKHNRWSFDLLMQWILRDRTVMHRLIQTFSEYDIKLLSCYWVKLEDLQLIKLNDHIWVVSHFRVGSCSTMLHAIHYLNILFYTLPSHLNKKKLNNSLAMTIIKLKLFCCRIRCACNPFTYHFYFWKYWCWTFSQFSDF